MAQAGDSKVMVLLLIINWEICSQVFIISLIFIPCMCFINEEKNMNKTWKK